MPSPSFAGFPDKEAPCSISSPGLLHTGVPSSWLVVSGGVDQAAAELPAVSSKLKGFLTLGFCWVLVTAPVGRDATFCNDSLLETS